MSCVGPNAAAMSHSGAPSSAGGRTAAAIGASALRAKGENTSKAARIGMGWVYPAMGRGDRAIAPDEARQSIVFDARFDRGAIGA